MPGGVAPSRYKKTPALGARNAGASGTWKTGQCSPVPLVRSASSRGAINLTICSYKWVGVFTDFLFFFRVSSEVCGPYTIGYCTNVHAGTDVPTISENLQKYAVAVRDALGDQDLGVGLWIPNQASEQLAKGSAAADFRQFLDHHRLRAFTINGFPFDNFHQRVVKHRVYLPPWWDERRLDYTERLANILSILLPTSETVGSISTLPIGWPNNPCDRVSSADQPKLLQRAGANLRKAAGFLEQVESRCGRRIVLAIEPEPGCILDTSADLVAWFETHLPDQLHRRYITVCHDVCHAAVMMEPQAEVLSRFAKAGITVGKVQVSSAIVANWQSMDQSQQVEARQQLSEFAEDRYLHQTGRRTESGGFELVEDLPPLVRGELGGDRKWVVHFHVPIFLERFGQLTTSHDDVLECLRTISQLQVSGEPKLEFTGHLEVETYAWTVMPESVRKQSLAEDIASEIQWLRKQMENMER